MMQKLFHYASPQNFYPLAGKLWPVFALAGAVLSVWGLWLGMFVAPTDFQQGEGYRIIFVHVPVSWMSMIIYLAMAALASPARFANPPEKAEARPMRPRPSPQSWKKCRLVRERRDSFMISKGGMGTLPGSAWNR